MSSVYYIQLNNSNANTVLKAWSKNFFHDVLIVGILSFQLIGVTLVFLVKSQQNMILARAFRPYAKIYRLDQE